MVSAANDGDALTSIELSASTSMSFIDKRPLRIAFEGAIYPFDPKRLCAGYIAGKPFFGHISYFVAILDVISAYSALTLFQILFARLISSEQGASCAR